MTVNLQRLIIYPNSDSRLYLCACRAIYLLVDYLHINPSLCASIRLGSSMAINQLLSLRVCVHLLKHVFVSLVTSAVTFVCVWPRSSWEYLRFSQSTGSCLSIILVYQPSTCLSIILCLSVFLSHYPYVFLFSTINHPFPVCVLLTI